MFSFEPERQPKLLILYASYGEGHLQAARAIRDALAERGNRQTVMIDLMAESHPWLNEMTRLFYLKSYTHMPSLYGLMYGMTRPMKHDSLLAGFLHGFGREKIMGILKKERPDAVIHTFPFFALPAMGRRSSFHIPSYAVITDFDLHRRWVHPRVDRYYVATDDLKRELMSLGIPAGRVAVSGIPLKRGFRAQEATTELHRKYGLSPLRPTVLIMAGAHGVLPNALGLCARLLASSPSLQVALVCGRNAALKAAADERFAGRPEASRFRAFGYVEPIHELMAIASCLVTKPGGVTLSEAIEAGVPIFTYRPVPGQERRNAVYLASKGAAVVSNNQEKLVNHIVELLEDPLRLQLSRLSVKRLQRGAAADMIADDILSSFASLREAAMV